MMSRLVCLCWTFAIAGVLNSQELMYFCGDTSRLTGDAEFQRIRAFLQPAFEKDYGKNAPDVAYHLLSAEKTEFALDKYPCLKLAYHTLLANVLRQMGALEEARNEAMIALRQDSVFEAKFAAEMYSLVASIAYELQDYHQARYYFDKNLEVAIREPDVRNRAGGYNNLALAYFRLDSLERAKALFTKAQRELEASEHRASHIHAAVLDNLADLALTASDTGLAMQLLIRKDSILSQIKPDTARMIDTWMLVADLHLRQGQPAKALGFLESARKLLPEYSGRTSALAYDLDFLWYSYYDVVGEEGKAQTALKQMQYWHAQMQRDYARRQQEVADILRDYANYDVRQVRKLAEVQIAQEEKERKYQARVFYLLLLIGALVLIAVLAYFYYRQKVNRQRITSLELSVDLNNERLRTQSLERELLQKELDAKAYDLTSIAIDNARRKEWTEEVMDSLRVILAKPPEQRTREIKDLYYQLLHRNQIQKRLNFVQENPDVINKSFLDKLRLGYPDLTEAELDLCILLRLGLSGKEIAVVRNIDPESIRKAKYRLRKKMRFETPEALQVALKGL